MLTTMKNDDDAWRRQWSARGGRPAHSCGHCGETLWVPTTKPGGAQLLYVCTFVYLYIYAFQLLWLCISVFLYVCTFVYVCVRENGLVANKGKGLQPRGTPCDALPADLWHPCLPPALVCPFHPKDNARCYTVPYQNQAELN